VGWASEPPGDSDLRRGEIQDLQSFRVVASEERAAGKAPDGVGRPSEEIRVKRVRQLPMRPNISEI